MHVLFVCHGNTCRSPMAAGIARRLTLSWPDSPDVVSAGLWAGTTTAEHAVQVLAEIGMDISGNSPQELDQSLVDVADVIVPLDHAYADEIVERFPEAAERIRHLPCDIQDPLGSPVSKYREVRDQLIEAVGAMLRQQFAGRTLDDVPLPQNG